MSDLHTRYRYSLHIDHYQLEIYVNSIVPCACSLIVVLIFASCYSHVYVATVFELTTRLLHYGKSKSPQI